MSEQNRSGELAIILHADVAGSTEMVQRDEVLAHERIQAVFRRLGNAVSEHSGRVLELRGDALLAEFSGPSNAVSAALAFQQSNRTEISRIDDDLKPELRIGIAMGEVVIADNTVTGAGVVLAQRIEQLAQPGSVCVAAAVREALPERMPFQYQSLGEVQLKGFSRPILVYRVDPADQPGPPPLEPAGIKQKNRSRRNWLAAAFIAITIAAGVAYHGLNSPSPGLLTEESREPALPDKPSIVVLPFTNLYDHGHHDYFVDGMTSSITTYLSKFKELFVISNTTALTYRERSVPVREIGQQLGVAYALEGSVQQAAGQISVQVQLIETATERNIWAEEYHVALAAVLDVQSDIIAEIVGTLSATLKLEVQQKALNRPLTDLHAYDLYLRALAITRISNRDSIAAGIDLLNQAIAIDPGFLDAHFQLSDLHLNAWRFGRSDNPEESLRQSRHHAARVLAIDQTDYRGHYLLGKIQLFADHNHELALAAYHRALADNPNDTSVLYNLGFLHTLMGNGEEAIRWNNRAKRVNPRYPAWYNINAAVSHFWIRDYENAILLARSVIAAYPTSLAPRRALIASLVEMGHLQEARQEAWDYMIIKPDFSLSSFKNTPWQNPQDQERYYNALIKAGIPE